jgi:hypothetical protein
MRFHQANKALNGGRGREVPLEFKFGFSIGGVPFQFFIQPGHQQVVRGGQEFCQVG